MSLLGRYVVGDINVHMNAPLYACAQGWRFNVDQDTIHYDNKHNNLVMKYYKMRNEKMENFEEDIHIVFENE